MMKEVVPVLLKLTDLNKKEIQNLIEVPPSQELGDYAFPCFVLAKKLKKSPNEIAQDLVKKISIGKNFEKIEAKGPYVNFFMNRKILAEKTLKKILKEREKYGLSKVRNNTVVIEFSSPNIAKPFGIGHLRSTLIGNSISNIASFLGFKTIKINYLGDWGTPFGKVLLGYKKFGSEKELKKDPVKHLFEVYVRVSEKKELENEAREMFRKLETGDKDILQLWKKFRKLSTEYFKKIYSTLEIKFDIISGESEYNKKAEEIISKLREKNLISESEGAQIINLEKENLGTVLIKKSDDTTLYATREIAAAIDRHKRYHFRKMIYEVGAEQKLHFRQVFKVLEFLGYRWYKDCIHVEHGLYLDEEGKKFATRKGSAVFLEEVINKTKDLAKKELIQRGTLQKSELEKRAKAIAIAAIIYGDLKNYRANDSVFDIKKFINFEGDTGPYLLYTCARAKSILKKAKKIKVKQIKIKKINDLEKNLILKLSSFREVVENSWKNFSPNIIAGYSYSLAKEFGEFYHSCQVIGSENEPFRLALVEAVSVVLKNSLALLGIKTLEQM